MDIPLLSVWLWGPRNQVWLTEGTDVTMRLLSSSVSFSLLIVFTAFFFNGREKHMLTSALLNCRSVIDLMT